MNRCQEKVGVHRGCMNGLARVKAYWTDMEATIVATQNLAGGQGSGQALLGAGNRRCSFDRGSVLEECNVRVTNCVIVKTMLF